LADEVERTAALRARCGQVEVHFFHTFAATARKYGFVSGPGRRRMAGGVYPGPSGGDTVFFNLKEFCDEAARRFDNKNPLFSVG